MLGGGAGVSGAGTIRGGVESEAVGRFFVIGKFRSSADGRCSVYTCTVIPDGAFRR